MIIDEFPYMCKGNAAIPSILQNLWDHTLKDSDVMLVLCGSSISFMEDELLGSKNPLYGRATWIYKVNQLSFENASQFFPNYSHSEKIIAYSILGGIPHYLQQFDPDESLENNIKDQILTKGSPLYNETEFLLKQELRETQIYNTLIETIALGSTSLNEISQKAFMETTSKTAIYLKKLIEIQLVDKIFSVDAPLKEHGNANRGYYELSDNFFRFCYTFVYSNYSELEPGDVDGVYEAYVAPNLHEFPIKITMQQQNITRNVFLPFILFTPFHRSVFNAKNFSSTFTKAKEKSV